MKKWFMVNMALGLVVFFQWWYVFENGGFSGDNNASGLIECQKKLEECRDNTVSIGEKTVDVSGWRGVEAKVTAYVPITERHGKFNDGNTSIMDDATVLDGVAADPRAIPYRSRVLIPGVGVKEVDDTGSAMRKSWRERGEYHIDLRVRNSRIANNWGVKRMTIFIREE